MSKTVNDIIIIGAGPVGLAAAAQAISRGLQPIVLEKGQTAGAAMSQWGHVEVFTPWKYVFDKQVKGLLDASGWNQPNPDAMPTGQQIVDEYLIPAANTPELLNAIHYGSEVIAFTKKGLSKSASEGRDKADYKVHVKRPDGQHRIYEASAVIDASGTWSAPNPIGLDGLPVGGERENQDRITYGIPDVKDKAREQFEGQRTLVIGGGHSAINVALDLMKLQQESPETKIFWGLRENNIDKLLGGGINDALPARGELGIAAKSAIDTGALTLLAPLEVQGIENVGNGLKLSINVDGVEQTLEVDQIVVSTGFRPDISMLRELRLDLDEVVEAPSKLAPLIDPNLHSCGTVRPHGVEELSHPDKHFFVVGMKAYGRAPTFLMMTGYEQVRSIVAELAGDHESARRVELELPETGICSSDKLTGGSSACCAPAEEETGGCCGSAKPAVSEKSVADEKPKSSGGCCGPSNDMSETKETKQDTGEAKQGGCCWTSPAKVKASSSSCCG